MIALKDILARELGHTRIKKLEIFNRDLSTKIRPSKNNTIEEFLKSIQIIDYYPFDPTNLDTMRGRLKDGEKSFNIAVQVNNLNLYLSTRITPNEEDNTFYDLQIRKMSLYFANGEDNFYHYLKGKEQMVKSKYYIEERKQYERDIDDYVKFRLQTPYFSEVNKGKKIIDRLLCLRTKRGMLKTKGVLESSKLIDNNFGRFSDFIAEFIFYRDENTDEITVVHYYDKSIQFKDETDPNDNITYSPFIPGLENIPVYRKITILEFFDFYDNKTIRRDDFKNITPEDDDFGFGVFLNDFTSETFKEELKGLYILEQI